MELKKTYNYHSTRNENIACSAKEAILQGIADDGGLYVLDEIDKLQLPLEKMMDMNYQQMVEVVFSLLLPDFSVEEIKQCVFEAYTNTFDDEDITPLKTIDDVHILELFHGPTCAFKDVGLQMLPQLMKVSLQKADYKDIMILTATSGDTGKAALEGFKNVDHVGISVFYPHEKVSKMQQLQMETTTGKNTKVCAIEGNFDDAQSNVKSIFQNQMLKAKFKEHQISLSSANSINIGRLIPQVVYYIFAYKEMVKTKQIRFMDEMNVCVPTGNFGNVLAGYYAKCMGLPIKKFLVASNENNVLYDFINTGKYDRNRAFLQTISPSMDILISSNLERMLYYKSNHDCAYVNMLMQDLKTKGYYQVSDTMLASIQKDFYGGYCNNEDCAKTIKACFDDKGYVLDPHTAVGYYVMNEYQKQDMTPCVLLSTASPYKFAHAICDALALDASDDEFVNMNKVASVSKMTIPTSLKGLQQLPILHHQVIQKEDMEDYVEKVIKEMFYD